MEMHQLMEDHDLSSSGNQRLVLFPNECHCVWDCSPVIGVCVRETSQ